MSQELTIGYQSRAVSVMGNRQVLPVATPEATRSMVKVIAITYPPKISEAMRESEWLDLATKSIGCHPESVLRKAVEIVLTRQKFPNVSVHDIVMAILTAYRELEVVLSPDARILRSRVTPPQTTL